jgi:transcriptional regulator with XRE-family HTH domain
MAVEDSAREFGQFIRTRRVMLGWSQDDLAEKSGVGRATIQRYEYGRSAVPNPDAVRKIFAALQVDQRLAAVVLGYVTAEEMGLPPEPPRVFSRTVEEVIAMLEDPDVPQAAKDEGIAYLRYRLAHGGPSAATG